MNRERTDLDIPEDAVPPSTDRSADRPDAQLPDARPSGVEPSGVQPPDVQPPAGQPPAGQPTSLDPDRDDAERNAAAGGWDGANEQIENDFEAEQLRRAQAESADEDVPLT